jgi:hypothetical protein
MEKEVLNVIIFLKLKLKHDMIFVMISGGGGNFLISSSCVGYIDSLGGCSPFCRDGYTMIYCFSSKKGFYLFLI